MGSVADDDGIWIFGFGSLIHHPSASVSKLTQWRDRTSHRIRHLACVSSPVRDDYVLNLALRMLPADFEYSCRVEGYVKGWRRVFWQVRLLPGRSHALAGAGLATGTISLPSLESAMRRYIVSRLTHSRPRNPTLGGLQHHGSRRAIYLAHKTALIFPFWLSLYQAAECRRRAHLLPVCAAQPPSLPARSNWRRWCVEGLRPLPAAAVVAWPGRRRGARTTGAPRRPRAAPRPSCRSRTPPLWCAASALPPSRPLPSMVLRSAPGSASALPPSCALPSMDLRSAPDFHQPALGPAIQRP